MQVESELSGGGGHLTGARPQAHGKSVQGPGELDLTTKPRGANLALEDEQARFASAGAATRG